MSGRRLFLAEGFHETLVGSPVTHDPSPVIAHPPLNPQAFCFARSLDGAPLRDEAPDESMLVFRSAFGASIG